MSLSSVRGEGSPESLHCFLCAHVMETRPVIRSCFTSLNLFLLLFGLILFLQIKHRLVVSCAS